jgi:hypothetical protein
MNTKINLWFEEAILNLGKLKEDGNKKVARKAAERISKLGTIDERAVEIIRIEKVHSEDK